ncbi:MAG: MFS transporter [Candidatus Heimdallarchaeaceae archaeon]
MGTTSNDKLVQKQILKNPLMWKFKFYGFFKNLRFFEPYLIIMLYDYLAKSYLDNIHFLSGFYQITLKTTFSSPSGSSFILLQIGLIFLVQEVLTYSLEIPSGILADKFGKKNELLFCFGFYIISFVLYFIGLSLPVNFFFVIFLAAGMYGLGEAFRSGTHKAMILTWMDKKGYQKHKTFVYGRTRSWSLIGSTLNGVLSILLILFVPTVQWVFLIAIIPYILDFILITTYPSYMNDYVQTKTTFWKEFGQGFKGMLVAFKDKQLRKGIFSSSSYDAVYKSLKDYIQPIIKVYILVVIANIGFAPASLNLSEDNFIKVILGIMYSIFYMISSYSSRNAYRVKIWLKNAKNAMDILFYLFAAVLLLNAIFIWVKLPLAVIFFYLLIYIFMNVRRPLAVDYLGEIINKEQRTTMLSVEAQIKSVLVFIFAPLFGLIADFSIPALFLGLAVIMVVYNFFILQGDNWTKKNEKRERNILSDEPF